MTRVIKLYLRGRGSRKMSDCVSGSPTSWHTLLAKYQDRLGWQNFIEGRFVSIFVQIQRRHLETSESWITAESWATGLMEQLLRLTHRQWLHRNAKVHFRRSDGRTASEFEETIEKIKHLLWTDPDDLLPENRSLFETDFWLLGASSAMDQEYWLAEMETAILAASHRD